MKSNSSETCPWNLDMRYSLLLLDTSCWKEFLCMCSGAKQDAQQSTMKNPKHNFRTLVLLQISPNAAPATKNDTWTSPNAAPATKSNTWTSPNAAPGNAIYNAWSTTNNPPTSPYREKKVSWSNPVEAWNAIYNARSSTSDPPTSPNGAPVPKKRSHHQSS